MDGLGAELQKVLSTQVLFSIGVMLFWLSIYVFTRGPRRRSMRLLSLAILLVCSYFLQVGLGRTAKGVEEFALWIRLLWPFVPLTSAVWLHTTLELGTEENDVTSRRLHLFLYLVIYPVALILGLLGSFSDFLFLYPGEVSPIPWEVYRIDPGPGYYGSTLFLAVVLGFSEWQLVRLWRHTGGVARPRFLYLLIGTLIATVGALYLSLNQLLSIHWPEWIGEIMMAAGIFVVAYEVVAYETGLQLRTEFLYCAIRTAAATIVYIGVIALMMQLTYLSTALPLLSIALLVVASHTLYNTAADWMDWIFLDEPARKERAEGRRFLRAAVTNPVHTGIDLREYSDEDLYRLVREAVGNLSNVPALASRPLANLYVVRQRLRAAGQSLSPANRATMLQAILLELIEELRPKNHDHDLSYAGRSFASLYYGCYHKLYRYTATPEERHILDFLGSVSKRTINRWQEDACRLICTQLRHLEEEARKAIRER